MVISSFIIILYIGDFIMDEFYNCKLIEGQQFITILMRHYYVYKHVIEDIAGLRSTVGRAPDSLVRGPEFDIRSGHILSFLLKSFKLYHFKFGGVTLKEFAPQWSKFFS